MKKKGFDYFACLVRMSNFALEEAKLLRKLLENYTAEDLANHRADIHKLEHQCDEEKHGLYSVLMRDFLPPIEREDLFSLAHITDDLTDSVECIVAFLYMADVQTLRDDTLSFADLVVVCCENVVELLGEFHNFKKSSRLRELVIKLNDLEEQGDRLYHDAMRRLSCDRTVDTRDLIEWRDIYRIFESCFDAAESIADSIEAVVMKST